jgi:YD repeat-containing protein
MSGASITTPTTFPGANQIRTYGLDGLGNWKNGSFGTISDPTVEVRQHNYVNEITSVKDTVGGTPTTTGFTYDHGNNAASADPNVQLQGNGNLINDGVRIYQWDAFNRLIQVSNASTSAVLATYVYDALNRRIQKTITDVSGGYGGLTGDIPAGTTDYLYDGQQILSECNHAEPTAWTQMYFWGQYTE